MQASFSCCRLRQFGVTNTDGQSLFWGMSCLQGDSSGRGLGWVDMNFECSTVCPILPGLMGIWQKRLGKMVEHPNLSQPNPGPRPEESPCIAVASGCIVPSNPPLLHVYFLQAVHNAGRQKFKLDAD